jgi:hypothetical protein
LLQRDESFFLFGEDDEELDEEDSHSLSADDDDSADADADVVDHDLVVIEDPDEGPGL